MIASCSLEVADSPHQAGGPKEQPLAAPLFTIITACRNSSATIDDCLASVAAQNIDGVEHVVVDRHSRDDTIERLHAHRHRLSIVYGSANDTRFQAWNRGIGHASGDILGFVDGTDALANPHVLRRVAAAFQDPEISAVYGDVLCVDARDIDHVMMHHYVGPVSRKRLSRGWVPPTTALFVRKPWYLRIDGFSPNMKSAADYEALLRLFSYPFFKVAYLGVPVVKQRLTAPSIRQLRGIFGSPGEELLALRSTRVGGWQALAWRSLARIGHWL
jgi:glycosyltransferase